MKKKTQLDEVRRLQKIAGLLKEDDIDLSNTPRFRREGEEDMLLAFLDNIQDAAKYEKLGFTVEVDDAANGIYSAEKSVKGYDGLAILSALEDCKIEGLAPMLIYRGEEYDFEKALEFADELASRQASHGQIRENDLDLSDTPDFKSRPRTVEEFLEEEDFINWLIDSIHENLDWENTHDLIYNYIIKNKTLEDFKDAWENYQDEVAGGEYGNDF